MLEVYVWICDDHALYHNYVNYGLLIEVHAHTWIYIVVLIIPAVQGAVSKSYSVSAYLCVAGSARLCYCLS